MKNLFLGLSLALITFSFAPNTELKQLENEKTNFSNNENLNSYKLEFIALNSACRKTYYGQIDAIMAQTDMMISYFGHLPSATKEFLAFEDVLIGEAYDSYQDCLDN